MNTLSVVIITFNEEQKIAQCLDSVQDIADEIIVVDSHSTDATEAICDRFEALERTQFDGLDEAEAARTRGFFADHDEMVDCSAEFERYYPGRSIRYPGGHLPNYPEIKTYILPHLLP